MPLLRSLAKLTARGAINISLLRSGDLPNRFLSSALGDGDGADAVAAHDAVDDVHPLDDAAEDRVAAVEVRLRRVRDEPLRPARVLARERHPDRAAAVGRLVDLAAY